MIQGGKRRVVCHGASHCGAGGLYKRRGSASCAPGPRPTSRTQTPWRRSKKLSRPRGRDPPEACTRHTDRGVVPGRDAGWPEEQAHLSMGQEGLTPPRRSRSTHPVDLSVRGCLPRTRGWRRPSTAGLQQRGHATPPRRNRNQSYPRRARDRPPRSSRVAWRQGSQGPKQPLAHAAAAARTRTQRSGKYLAIHAAELALEPCLQILRRHRRPLLLRLEHAYRSTLEDHVHRAPRLGERRLLNVRIGMSRADTVAKLFWAPERATLIQEQRLMRNIDSKILFPRFDYCVPAACRRVLQQNLPIADSCTAANSIFIRSPRRRARA